MRKMILFLSLLILVGCKSVEERQARVEGIANNLSTTSSMIAGESKGKLESLMELFATLVGGFKVSVESVKEGVGEVQRRADNVSEGVKKIQEGKALIEEGLK